MNPNNLLSLLSHPTEMARKVNAMMTEQENTWNMNGPQLENELVNENPRAGMEGLGAHAS